MTEQQTLSRFTDFEGIMLELAQQEGWEFEYEGKPLSPALVFNEATFAPALLQAAQLELNARGVAQDLGLVLEADEKSMFGKRVRFDAARNTLMACMWRFAQCAYQLQELPRNGSRINLDLVPAVLAADPAPAPQAKG